MNEVSLTTTFSGSYELLKYIIHKYGIYGGKLKNYLSQNQYTQSKSCYQWNFRGPPLRAWNALHKDLTILKLQGLIEFENLQQLKEEHERIN